MSAKPFTSSQTDPAASVIPMPPGDLFTIRCYQSPPRYPAKLSWERLLAAQALQLLMRLDGELRLARGDWNDDRFRRIMRARSKAVVRAQRRWKVLNPAPQAALGSLRRRFHANMAGYLYPSD